MTPSERTPKMNNFLSAIMIQNDVPNSAKLEGRIEGLAEGREENNKMRMTEMNERLSLEYRAFYMSSK